VRDTSTPALDDAGVKLGCEDGDWREIFEISWSKYRRDGGRVGVCTFVGFSDMMRWKTEKVWNKRRSLGEREKSERQTLLKIPGVSPSIKSTNQPESLIVIEAFYQPLTSVTFPQKRSLAVLEVEVHISCR
jgi:hypothetical protein